MIVSAYPSHVELLHESVDLKFSILSYANQSWKEVSIEAMLQASPNILESLPDMLVFEKKNILKVNVEGRKPYFKCIMKGHVRAEYDKKKETEKPYSSKYKSPQEENRRTPCKHKSLH